MVSLWSVLILVVVEYALWGAESRDSITNMVVLILVVVEYALWVCLCGQWEQCDPVLILVVVEYALWVFEHYDEIMVFIVLILVVVEYALWDCADSIILSASRVLILVVVEYALWELHTTMNTNSNNSLNPCCSGICSLRKVGKTVSMNGRSLNPCCSGICSLRFAPFLYYSKSKTVLILVVVEYALWVCIEVLKENRDVS